MTNTQLTQSIREFSDSLVDRLEEKQKQYSTGNPFSNFIKAGQMKNIPPTTALDGFMLKHLVWYDDLLKKIENGNYIQIDEETIDERLGDIIVYFLIQRDLLKETLKLHKKF